MPGGVLLVTRGDGHRLYTDPDVDCPQVLQLPHAYEDDRYALLRHGGGGAPGVMVCGIVRMQTHTADALVSALPPILHLDGLTSLQADWMASSVRLMAAEARGLLPGGETIVTRLADILVVQAIRCWLQRDGGARVGWLGALRDPQIGRALARVHRHPGEGWSLDALASTACMSRSAFAARFSDLVGEPPMRYVARIRMGAARDLLAAPGARVGEVARALGYRSEAAFNRAFKRHTGVTPGAIRRGA